MDIDIYFSTGKSARALGITALDGQLLIEGKDRTMTEGAPKFWTQSRGKGTFAGGRMRGGECKPKAGSERLTPRARF